MIVLSERIYWLTFADFSEKAVFKSYLLHVFYRFVSDGNTNTHSTDGMVYRLLAWLIDRLMIDPSIDRSMNWLSDWLNDWLFLFCLTYLAVIPSVTRGRARMQKTVTESYSRYGLWNRWPWFGGCSRGESVINWPFATELSISHSPYLLCHIDLIDTTSLTKSYMLTCTNFVFPSSVFPDTI